MKYVVVEISGRQFWLEQGQSYELNKIPAEINQSIILDRVLFFDDGSQFSFGLPYLETVTVKATITKHLRSHKTIVYKMRPKKKTRKKQGHRQERTRVFIENITIT
uniref:Large ribosomal subunit protein bL21c n=1 Tax=Proboscia sp. TaxID=1923967 RepID=A0A2U9NMA7_9STRA|nr:ribosomal protein L21 [Proboscia sp.]